jgi:hypothetical protein
MATITNYTLDNVAGYLSEYLEGAYGMPAGAVTPSMVEAVLVNKDTTLVEEKFGETASYIARLIREAAEADGVHADGFNCDPREAHADH